MKNKLDQIQSAIKAYIDRTNDQDFRRRMDMRLDKAKASDSPLKTVRELLDVAVHNTREDLMKAGSLNRKTLYSARLEVLRECIRIAEQE